MSFSRREFLRSFTAIASLRLTGGAALGVLGLSMSSTPASANPVLIALAVASFVMTLIAQANRSDGGFAAFVKADLALLQQITQSLADVQAKLADVLNRLDTLPATIDQILRNNNTRVLQSAMSGAITGYIQSINDRAHYASETAWRASTLYPNSQRLLSNIQTARESLQATNACDPATAIVASQACIAECALMATLVFPSFKITTTLDIYEAWFRSMLDPTTQGSVLSYQAAAKSALDEAVMAANQSEIGQHLATATIFNDNNPQWSRFAECIGVNDVTEAHYEDEPAPCPPGQDQFPIQCTDSVLVPERDGVRTRYVMMYELTVENFTEENTKTNIKTFTFRSG